jgi:ABC-type Mn2+/Zn2+ transport system permease subunit
MAFVAFIAFLLLLLSYLFNAPPGAVIIIVSSATFGLALLFSPKRKAKKIKGGENESSHDFFT